MASDWPTSLENYELMDVIGYGGFAVVHRARCEVKDSFVAVKVVDMDSVGGEFESLHQEITTMRLAQHNNVLTCYTAFPQDSKLYLVMPLMNKGSFLNVLQTIKDYPKTSIAKGIEDEVLLASILKQAAEGIQYLHNQGCIHRDIKAGNILADSEGNIRIGDFGVSSLFISSRARSRRTFVGTPCWMAPEVMEQVNGYDTKADIWSLGITTLELLMGEAPYAKLQPIRVMLKTLEGDPPSVNSYISDKNEKKNLPKISRNFKDFITMCLQKDPSKRPTISKLLTHKFFSKAEGPDYIVANLLGPIPDIYDVSRLTRPVGYGGLVANGIRDTQDEKDQESKFVHGATWVFDLPDEGKTENSEPKNEEESVISNIEKAINSIGIDELSKPRERESNTDSTKPSNLTDETDLETFVDEGRRNTEDYYDEDYNEFVDE